MPKLTSAACVLNYLGEIIRASYKKLVRDACLRRPQYQIKIQRALLITPVLDFWTISAAFLSLSQSRLHVSAAPFKGLRGETLTEYVLKKVGISVSKLISV